MKYWKVVKIFNHWKIQGNVNGKWIDYIGSDNALTGTIMGVRGSSYFLFEKEANEYINNNLMNN